VDHSWPQAMTASIVDLHVRRASRAATGCWQEPVYGVGRSSQSEW